MGSAPLTNAVRGRRRTGQAAEVAEALIPSPTSKDPPTARNGRPTASRMLTGATAATADEEAARKAGGKELLERGSPVEVQQELHQEEAAGETGGEELPERGSPVEAQQELHQEEAALIFCSSRYETVSNCCFKTTSYLFIILGLFDYVSNAISNYVQNF